MRPERACPEAVVEALGLDGHVAFDDLLATVSEVHGKPIEVKEIDGSAIPTLTGLWVEKKTKSMILLPAGDSELHRHHAACHEFGHILLNHHGCGRAPGSMPSVFRHIGGRMGIERMLARSQEWTETEKDAERVAYLLGRVLRPQERRSPSRFERTFE
jgi:hypothetical protein